MLLLLIMRNYIATAHGLVVAGHSPCLLHVEGTMNLELQCRGDCLHAHNTAETCQGVPQVRVHLAMLQEVLLTMQWHLTNATAACVQTFAMGDLVLSQGEQGREALPTDGAHIVFDRSKVGLHMFPQPSIREEGARANIALVVALDHFSFPFHHGTLTRAYIVVPQLVVSEE